MRVICNKHAICTHDDMCGAKKPHDNSSCEKCPFDENAKCVEVQPVLTFMGEEYEMY